MLLPRGAGRAASSMKNYRQTPVIKSQSGSPYKGTQGMWGWGRGQLGSWATNHTRPAGQLHRHRSVSSSGPLSPPPFLISRKAPWWC